MQLSRLLAVIGAAVVVGCDSPVRTPEIAAAEPGGCLVGGVTVSPATLALSVGDTARFAAKVNACPGQILSSAVKWRSSNRAIVSVDSASGLAQAVALGQASVTAILASNASISGAAVVQVNAR
jgi:uncharacterized protein YjdB